MAGSLSPRGDSRSEHGVIGEACWLAAGKERSTRRAFDDVAFEHEDGSLVAAAAAASPGKVAPLVRGSIGRDADLTSRAALEQTVQEHDAVHLAVLERVRDVAIVGNGDVLEQVKVVVRVGTTAADL